MLFNDQYENAEECVVALGCFDGVHRGHQSLIARAREAARNKKVPLLIWTLSMKRDNLLQSPEEKFYQLERLGADAIISEDFDKIRFMTCESFVSLLINQYKACHAVCGYNFTFGVNASGNAAHLLSLMASHGKTGEIVEEFSLDGLSVSSTAIRNALTSGNPVLAGKMLGRFYEINGNVEKGFQIGRTLGFPTANQVIPKGKIVPRFGVYRSFCDVNHKRYPALTNIGCRPTYNDDPETITVESYILGDVGDIYGQYMSTKLADFIRPERRFDSEEELREAINQDVLKVKKECGIKFQI